MTVYTFKVMTVEYGVESDSEMFMVFVKGDSGGKSLNFDICGFSF
jgi:hypothetical protein